MAHSGFSSTMILHMTPQGLQKLAKAIPTKSWFSDPSNLTLLDLILMPDALPGSPLMFLLCLSESFTNIGSEWQLLPLAELG